MALRRVRGMLLRLARRRGLAIAIGTALVVPAAWWEWRGSGAWWVDGLSLVVGATGAALMWTGLVGLPPDWMDEG